MSSTNAPNTPLDARCSICLTSFDDADVVRTIISPCGHTSVCGNDIVAWTCGYNGWADQRNHLCCPLCRTEITNVTTFVRGRLVLEITWPEYDESNDGGLDGRPLPRAGEVMYEADFSDMEADPEVVEDRTLDSDELSLASDDDFSISSDDEYFSDDIPDGFSSGLDEQTASPPELEFEPSDG